jgi:hypothetical protein
VISPRSVSRESSSLAPPQPVRILQIPEETLAALLKKAGIPMPPLDFLKGHAPVIAIGLAYQKRAKSAYWSQMWLGISAAGAGLSVLFSWGIEDLLSFALLAGMTVVETRVRKWFQAGDPRGAVVGYRNQCAFALLFLVYGAYHSFTVTVPTDLAAALGAPAAAFYVQGTRAMYAILGLGGCLGQYLLARYYRSAPMLPPLPPLVSTPAMNTGPNRFLRELHCESRPEDGEETD